MLACREDFIGSAFTDYVTHKCKVIIGQNIADSVICKANCINAYAVNRICKAVVLPFGTVPVGVTDYICAPENLGIELTGKRAKPTL